MEKIQFDISGRIAGFRKDGESLVAAIARLMCEAEMYGNYIGHTRIHILKANAETLTRLPFEPKIIGPNANLFNKNAKF